MFTLLEVLIRDFLLIIRIIKKDNNPNARTIDNMIAIMPPALLEPMPNIPVSGTAGDGPTTLIVNLFIIGFHLSFYLMYDLCI